jgi:hypothetical protein
VAILLIYATVRVLRTAFEEGQTELLAPGTVLPEAFNAFWQLHRRGELTR